MCDSSCAACNTPVRVADFDVFVNGRQDGDVSIVEDEREKENRKAYQRQYRAEHLDEVRKKDRERRRKPRSKGEPIRVEKNVKVRFD